MEYDSRFAGAGIAALIGTFLYAVVWLLLRHYALRKAATDHPVVASGRKTAINFVIGLVVFYALTSLTLFAMYLSSGNTWANIVETTFWIFGWIFILSLIAYVWSRKWLRGFYTRNYTARAAKNIRIMQGAKDFTEMIDSTGLTEAHDKDTREVRLIVKIIGWTTVVTMVIAFAMLILVGHV